MTTQAQCVYYLITVIEKSARKGFAPVLIVVIVGLIAVLGISFFKGSVVDKKVDASSFSSYDDKINIKTPSEWTLKENPEQGTQAIFFSAKEGNDDKFIENVSVQVSDLSAKPDVVLSEVVKAWSDRSLSDYPNSFKITAQENTALDGIEAVRMTYLLSDGASPLKGMSTISLKDGRAYVISYAAEEKSYDKFLPDVEKLINSIKLGVQELSWESYKSDEYGYLLTKPVGWSVKDTPMENGREITIAHPQGKVVVIITALKDENLRDLDYMRNSIAAFKEKMENDSTMKVAKFVDQVEGDTGGFIAVGEEKKMDKNWYFEQRGLLGTSGKVLLFHGATLSSLYNDYKDAITRIIEGFKLE